MNVIVTAGGEAEPNHPFYKMAQGGLLSMIDIAGKPMVQWVLDALSASEKITRVVVAGLPPETDLVCAHPLILLPDMGDAISNIQNSAREIQRIDPEAVFTLLISGDIPLLRGEFIDWMLCHVDETADTDLYFSLIERSMMESEFPQAKRSYTRLKNAAFCSGDMHGFRLQSLTEENPLWKRLVESRKSRLRQASVLGYDTVFFLMLRQLTLKDAEATVCNRLGIKGQAVLSPYPEIGLHVTKPAHLEIVREQLAREKTAKREKRSENEKRV